jgi:amino acid transporter
MLSRLFIRKPLDMIRAEAEDETRGFHRSLTGMNLLLLGIGGIIGAGIFVLTGQASASYAGPAIVISFILSGVACAFAALCYAELAAMIPIAGSAYTYAYATLGQLLAWIIGWDLILEYLFGAATVGTGVTATGLGAGATGGAGELTTAGGTAGLTAATGLAVGAGAGRRRPPEPICALGAYRLP